MLTLNILSAKDIQDIHHTSLNILNKVGVIIRHEQIIKRLADAGAKVDFNNQRVWFDEEIVLSAIKKAPKQYSLHGRDNACFARFGFDEMNLISSPGQFAWIDSHSGKRRNPLLADAKAAIRLGDALPNITIVGAMGVPTDIPAPIRDVVLTSERIKGTTKPTRCWPITRKSSHYVLEMYAAVAGGKIALQEYPMVEIFLEPISPLQLPELGLDIMLEFLEYGQPVSIGPMSMAAGTGPSTLAGTISQENAEILAGIVVVQTLRQGTPVMYGGIPHIMDLRTSVCSFGSPEQGLMAIAMSQMGKYYGFPIYLNVNLTDSKILDIQAGIEKIGSFVLGSIAGADLFGHCGIVGGDHGASLPWLVVDNEIMEYIKRIKRGFTVNPETLAFSVIENIGPGGNYLSHAHTLAHFRKELWSPSPIWTRETYDMWISNGSLSMEDRALDKLQQITSTYQPEPIDVALSDEIDRIVESAKQELGN